MDVPAELQEYVGELVAAVGAFSKSLWLFGSRANGRAKLGSDWDLVLFADPPALEKLRTTPSLHRTVIDLLVAVDPKHWISPWPDGEKGPKGGSVELLDWKDVASGRATYRSRPVSSKPWYKEPHPIQEELFAYQIWP